MPLERAEASGLAPDNGCRDGRCATCRATVIAGRVAHVRAITATVAADEALICCAAPARCKEGTMTGSNSMHRRDRVGDAERLRHPIR